MSKKILISFILISFLHLSCVTSGQIVKPDDKEIEQSLIDISVGNISQLIDKGNSLKALQLILSVDDDQPEHSEVNKLYPQAISEIQQDFEKALEEDNYVEAIKYSKSFAALGLEIDENQPSLQELRIAYVMQLFKEEKDAAAISQFYEYLNFEDLSEEEFKSLEEKFIRAGVRGPLEKLFDYSVLKSMNAHPDTIRMMGSQPTVQDMIGGTVTVWVNRGIKIENGIGIPDRGIGSGFFIDRNGHILTNYHVISSEVDPEYEGFSRLFVKLSEDSEERIPAKVIGWDKELDLALLKTEVEPDYLFSFSREYNPVPGDKIFAIGSPGGLKNTMTSGTVSSLSRQLQTLGDSLQIDVPINPGNSGGPLLNSSGEVLGVIFAGIEQFEGVNFAIPVSDVKEILPELYRGGDVEHSFLGCALYERSGRLEVLYVTPGSPADQIGLMKDDIIETINGESFSKITEIQRFLLRSEPGELIRINWHRDEGILSAVASLDKRPEYPMEQALARDAFENLLVPFFGMEVERIAGRGDKNISYNISDVLPGTTADEAGISVGDSLLMRKWEADLENKIVIIQIIMKTRKAGFIESAVQIATYLAKGFFI